MGTFLKAWLLETLFPLGSLERLFVGYSTFGFMDVLPNALLGRVGGLPHPGPGAFRLLFVRPLAIHPRPVGPLAPGSVTLGSMALGPLALMPGPFNLEFFRGVSTRGMAMPDRGPVLLKSARRAVFVSLEIRSVPGFGREGMGP